MLFEYGYLSATLTRNRVALCHYTGAELPSDFGGVTYISMGTLEPNKPLSNQAKASLKSWAIELPTMQVGFSPTSQVHGYSGRWQVETTYEVYRHIPLKEPDYAVFKGEIILQIPANGDGGVGCAFGNLQVQVGDCFAEFEGSDRVVSAKVFSDGSMKLRNAIQSRQRTKLEGEPPQRDGFEPEFRGAREDDVFLDCPGEEPGIFHARFSTEVGGNIYSKATGKWYR